MRRFVIDPATLLEVVSHGVEVSAEHQIVAPGIIRSEALAALFAAVQRGDLTEEVALERHERVTELKMRLLNDRVSRRTAWKIAREQGWASIRDAEYLAITRLQADALVTVDAALAEKAQGLVPLAPLSALTTPSTT